MSGSAQNALLRGAVASSAGVSNNTAAPGAGTNLLFIQPTPGLYLVELWFGFSAGAPAAADLRNVQLQVGAAIFVVPVQPVLGRMDYFSFVGLLTAANQTIRLDTIGAATAGVGYLSGIVSTRIG